MKQLTLLRHAKSSRDDPALEDFDRPLNERGQRDAPAIAARLRQARLKPDLAVLSPARRSRETAEQILPQLGLGPRRTRLCAEIYEATAAALLELVRGTPQDCAHLLVIGHNPGLTELWNRLARQPTDNIPTCGVFSLRFPQARSWQELEPHSGETALIATPKGSPSEETDMASCLKGKKEAKEKPGNYSCKHCGAVSEKKGHLCEPKKIKEKDEKKKKK